MPLFQEAHNFAINGGNFVDNSGHGLGPLIYLQQFAASGAAHDSKERWPPPKCHPKTRKLATSHLLDRAKQRRAERLSSVLWLFAPAGMGKTAIAQTVAELCEEEELLAATFFFHRGDPQRNCTTRLVASIAFQLASSIAEIKPLIEEAVRTNPAVLDKALHIQLKKLIIEPMEKIAQHLTTDRIIIIDGLDECIGLKSEGADLEAEQHLVLQLIDTLQSLPLPLFVIILSRPEAWIIESFDSLPTLSSSTERFDLLENAAMDEDIITYFRSEFARIQKAPNHREEFATRADPWPSNNVVFALTWRAAGQFIYAATVVRYVEDPWDSPTARLRTILSPNLPADHNPLQSLDNLYLQILEQCRNHATTLEVLGYLMAFDGSLTFRPD
ncbi:hypothetical protein FA15DRAFT_567807, partial [Coprinopsis marcescibilis]